MFCKPQILKKLMKSSFKKHLLVVGNTGDAYYLRGTNWELICKKAVVPNSILAQIMELAGEIPKDGECFRTDVDGNQMMMLVESVEIPKNAEQITETDILIEAWSGEYQRVLQFDHSKEIYLINEMMYRMVDSEECDRRNGERVPEGPFCYPECGVYYKNGMMTLHLLFNDDDKHKELIPRLEKMDLMDRTPRL